jgi:WD40 repeat protein
MDASRGSALPKKQKLQLAMEEAELRTLKIPAAAHRGTLSPSKNSFLPTLQEQAQDRIQQRNRRKRTQKTTSTTEPGQEDPSKHMAPQEYNVLTSLDAPRLANIKQDFQSFNGQLDLEQFVQVMMQNISAQTGPEGGSARVGVSFKDEEADRKALSEKEIVFQTAAVVDLFRQIDVHGEGTLTWEEVSNYLIEQGMTGRDEFTVDNIKTYEASAVVDGTKHDDVVEKLVYLEQIDTMVCMSHNSRKFRLYDPKKCTLRHEVVGHRGTVINCCYVDSFNQIATTGADMTICLWDTSHLGLRNRLSTKDVQLCLQWCDQANSLFSGAIDGTLNRWDLHEMSLAEQRKGHHKKAINDLLMIHDINLLASASSDGSILMWDCAAMKPKKTFKGHRKGVFSLAYSIDYHCLLSAGLDQDALVWNPYVERVPIFRLKGHTHALCGVTVVPGTPQILTADVAGTFRLWDMRNFRCVQIFGGTESLHDLNTFCAMPHHKRLAAGSMRVTLYDYMDEWGGENVTDTAGVTDALYNDTMGAFYTLSKRSIKAWNASTGQLFKVLRDVARYEITSVCFAENERKIYVGNSEGHVCSHNLYNGTLLKAFESHAADISCLTIWKGTNRVISAAWDGTVKVHSDEKTQPPMLKAEFSHHKDGVTCLACSPELLLLASGGTDCQVILYDLRTLKYEHSLTQFKNVVSALDFLPSRGILAAADQGGLVSLWYVRPHDQKWTCICAFDNIDHFNEVYVNNSLGWNYAPGVLSPIALNAMKFVHFDETGQVVIYTADSKGNIRCWDLTRLFKRRNVQEVDLNALFSKMRGQGGVMRQLEGANNADSKPWNKRHTGTSPVPMLGDGDRPPTGDAPPRKRLSQAEGLGDEGGGAFLTGVDMGGADDEDDKPTTVRAARAGAGSSVAHSHGAATASHTDKSDVRVLYEVDGHSDSITSLHLLDHPKSIMTCGLDKKVKSWSLNLEPYGTLLQSRDRAFSFPYDPSGVRAAQLQEAKEVLDRTEQNPMKKPPAPSPTQEPPKESKEKDGEDQGLQFLQDIFSTSGRKRKPKAEPLWKFTAGQLEAEDNPAREDYHILYDQMSSTHPGDKVETRLLKQAHLKHAERMRQRGTALSKAESNAAERLARAMQSIGCDEYGTYERMAKSINPNHRHRGADHVFGDDDSNIEQYNNFLDDDDGFTPEEYG